MQTGVRVPRVPSCSPARDMLLGMDPLPAHKVEQFLRYLDEYIEKMGEQRSALIEKGQRELAYDLKLEIGMTTQIRNEFMRLLES